MGTKKGGPLMHPIKLEQAKHRFPHYGEVLCLTRGNTGKVIFLLQNDNRHPFNNIDILAHCIAWDHYTL